MVTTTANVLRINDQIAPLTSFLWLNTAFYFKTLFNKPDIVLCPKHIMPFMKVRGVKYITIFHDMSSKLNYVKRKAISVMMLNFYNWVSKIRADEIAAVSQSAADEVIDYYNIKNKKIKLIYNSILDTFYDEQNYNIDVLSKYNLEDKQYILAIATQNAHKNIPSLIRAFNKISPDYPDLKLVLIGKKGNDKEIYENQNKNIILTGYVDEKEIPALYKHSKLYVFPSKYEGFGIPVIEAQYTSTPLICSDIPVFREVAGEGAEFCGLEPDDIAEKIKLLLNNPERCMELIKLGLENVKRFSDEEIMKQVKDIIDG